LRTAQQILEKITASTDPIAVLADMPPPLRAGGRLDRFR
jgi:hypothetical protein